MSDALTLYGVTRASDRAALSFTVGGRVERRPVDVGQRVERGEVIARLDARPFRNQVRRARASMAEVDAQAGQIARDRARAERLYEVGASTRQSLEQASAGLDAAEAAKGSAHAQLSEARRLLRETVLRAPFDGVVTEVTLEAGEYAAPGRPVVLLTGAGAIEVEVEVPETYLSRVAVGDAVRVGLPGGVEERGEVTRLSRSAAGPGRLFPAIVTLRSTERARPGMTAEVHFRREGREVLTVPIAAIIDPSGDRPGVFRVSEGHVERVPVSVGRLAGRRVAVKAGLRPGDDVVVGGFAPLLDGDPVRVSRGERTGVDAGSER